MTTRERPGDIGADDARRLAAELGREIAGTRRSTGLSQRAAGVRAGISRSQLGRIERGELAQLTLPQLCRACRAVGLAPSVKAYPTGERVRDAGQMAVLGRLEVLFAPPLRMRREVSLPIAGDLRAWDARIFGDGGTASVECEARIHDAQALERRIELKVRDDPGAGIVILVVNSTFHNRRVVAEHREALRERFPLDGGAIARALRQGRLPARGGIILL